MPPAANISKKRKFVADGVFYAELNEVSITDVREQSPTARLLAARSLCSLTQPRPRAEPPAASPVSLPG